jgi:hypothetical protein
MKFLWTFRSVVKIFLACDFLELGEGGLPMVYNRAAQVDNHGLSGRSTQALTYEKLTAFLVFPHCGRRV